MDHHFENVRKIFPLNENRLFSYDEALDLIPLLLHISAKTKRELNTLNSQLSFTKVNTPKALEIQNKISTCLQNWSEKVRRLGAHPVSEFKIKHQPMPGCLSTVESIHQVILELNRMGLENTHFFHDNLMDVFRYTVHQQLELAQDPSRPGYRKKPFSSPETRQQSKKWQDRLLFFKSDKL
jgi:hypothetical protein